MCLWMKERRSSSPLSCVSVSVRVCGWCLFFSGGVWSEQHRWGCGVVREGEGEKGRERERGGEHQHCSACNDQFPYSRSLTSHPCVPPLGRSAPHLPLPPLKKNPEVLCSPAFLSISLSLSLHSLLFSSPPSFKPSPRWSPWHASAKPH